MIGHSAPVPTVLMDEIGALGFFGGDSIRICDPQGLVTPAVLPGLSSMVGRRPDFTSLHDNATRVCDPEWVIQPGASGDSAPGSVVGGGDRFVPAERLEYPGSPWALELWKRQSARSEREPCAADSVRSRDQP